MKTSKKLIAIRTDSSPMIGGGHVARCLTLAHILRRHNYKITFVSRCLLDNHKSLIESYDYSLKMLSYPMRDVEQNYESRTQSSNSTLAYEEGAWEEDSIQTLSLFAPNSLEWLILDNYKLGDQWQSKSRLVAKNIMVIDDRINLKCDCDLYLNQSIVSDKLKIEIGEFPVSCRSMIGPAFALLASNYAILRRKIQPRSGKINRIVVSFGLGDDRGLTEIILNVLLSLGLELCSIDVILGGGNTNKDVIYKAAASHENINIYEYLNDLSEIYSVADVVIGSGGISTWERCCLGVPAIVISIAENQELMSTQLDQLGVIKYLGRSVDLTIPLITQKISEIIKNDLSIAWSLNCLKLSDGRGAERVVEFMSNTSKSQGCRFKACRASLDDEMLLYKWANDPLTRANSLNPESISLEDHKEWFRRSIASNNCYIYVIKNESFDPIGVVRFDKYVNDWNISYSLDARFRGCGFGLPLLYTAIMDFKLFLPFSTICARVKADNLASLRLFRQMNYYERNKADIIEFHERCVHD